MNTRLKDLFSGSLFLLIACGICGYSFQTRIGVLTNPGPGFFSFCSGVLLFFLSLALLLKVFLRPNPISTKAATEVLRWKEISKFIFAIVAYSYGLERLGYLLTTLFFMLFIFRAIDPRPWWVIILASFCITAGSYILFQIWLKLNLPIGFWGI